MIPHKLLAQTGAGRNTTDYESNQNIFVQGDVADSVFFIQQGRVKVTVTSDQGKDAVIGILVEGQFFGEACLHGEPLRTATSTTLCHCRITSITKPAMLSAIRDQPKFSKLFMDHLLSRNGRIEEDVIDQLFNSSEKRLARLLLLLALWKGRSPVHRLGYSQSRDAGRNDWYYEVARQLFHEQIPQIRFHRLQRNNPRLPIASQRRSPRQAGDQGRVRTSKSWSSLNIGPTLFETAALSRISAPRRLKLALASE